MLDIPINLVEQKSAGGLTNILTEEQDCHDRIFFLVTNLLIQKLKIVSFYNFSVKLFDQKSLVHAVWTLQERANKQTDIRAIETKSALGPTQ